MTPLNSHWSSPPTPISTPPQNRNPAPLSPATILDVPDSTIDKKFRRRPWLSLLKCWGKNVRVRTVVVTVVLVAVYVVLSRALERGVAVRHEGMRIEYCGLCSKIDINIDVSLKIRYSANNRHHHHHHHHSSSLLPSPPNLDPHHLSYVNLSGAGLYSLRKKTSSPSGYDPVYLDSPPILSASAQTVMTTIAALGSQRYFTATGFEFCTALNNATFDSLAVISEWGDVTIAKRNPNMQEFTEFIDRHARRIMLMLYGRNQFLEAQELSRFACYAAADGANSVANLSPRRHYKLAYLIMSHGDDTVLKNIRTLLDSLDDGSAIFLIHLDPDADTLHQSLLTYIQEREKTLKNTPGNIFLSSFRYSGLYGHAGQVWMQLSGYFELMDLADWESVINLSAFDVPLRKSREIARVLARPENKGNEFIAHWGIIEMAVRFVRPHLLRTDPSPPEFITFHPPEAGLMYPPFYSWRVCRQHQWMILTRRFVAHLRGSAEAITALAFVEHTWVPDENYFCYVALNTPQFTSKVISDNKRYVTFQKCTPATSNTTNATNSKSPVSTTTPVSTPTPSTTRTRRSPKNETTRGTFFARKIDVRTLGGAELVRWIQETHVERFVARVGGFYGGEECGVSAGSVAEEVFGGDGGGGGVTGPEQGPKQEKQHQPILFITVTSFQHRHLHSTPSSPTNRHLFHRHLHPTVPFYHPRFLSPTSTNGKPQPPPLHPDLFSYHHPTSPRSIAHHLLLLSKHRIHTSSLEGIVGSGERMEGRKRKEMMDEEEEETPSTISPNAPPQPPTIHSSHHLRYVTGSLHPSTIVKRAEAPTESFPSTKASPWCIPRYRVPVASAAESEDVACCLRRRVRTGAMVGGMGGSWKG
ncbi:hypothetical protein BC829DRAFT_490264 [Chytridium lagenaria]|nr:hypothetical protein BC829DRAFT_490264 [Chytridium lagenaria]